MDDPTVSWSEDRYKECRDKILPFLKKVCGFKSEEMYTMPCSGYTGAFLLTVPPADVCPWFRFVPLIPPLHPLTHDRFLHSLSSHPCDPERSEGRRF